MAARGGVCVGAGAVRVVAAAGFAVGCSTRRSIAAHVAGWIRNDGESEKGFPFDHFFAHRFVAEQRIHEE